MGITDHLSINARRPWRRDSNGSFFEAGFKKRLFVDATDPSLLSVKDSWAICTQQVLS